MSYRAFASAVAFVLTFTLVTHARAQFGFSNLPEDDFTWRWGEQRRGIEDFSVRGIDTGFRCELTGMLRPGSRLTRVEMREMQLDLQASNFFIEAATNMMNALERQRELQWAVLDCVKQGDDD